MKKQRNPELLKEAGIVVRDEEAEVTLWGNKKKLLASMGATDWYKYFAVQNERYNNFKMPLKPTVKELAVLKSLVNNYSPEEIKQVIDFVWEKPESINKWHKEITIFIISRNYKFSELLQKSVGYIDKEVVTPVVTESEAVWG